jgi:hypothetical protein
MSEIRIRAIDPELTEQANTIAKNYSKPLSRLLIPVIRQWIKDQPDRYKQPIRTDLDSADSQVR